MKSEAIKIEKTEEKPPIQRADLFNMEAEQIILGSIIMNNEYVHRINEFLLPEHFYEPAHQKIYNQILHNINKVNIVANEVTLKQFFENNETIASFGGVLYLSTLLSKATGIIDITDYAHLIHDLALKRELVIIGEDIVNNTYKADENSDANEQIEAAEANLFNLAHQGSANNDFKNISHSLQETLDKTLIAKEREGNISGVPTGLKDLDKILGGMQNSDLIILAGRPSMGKAQPLDAKILTNSGFRRMGDLKIGDEIASFDGKKSKITGIFPQGKKEIYKITLTDGSSTKCCLEHLWQVNFRKWKAPKVLNTKQLIELLEKPSYQNRIFIENFSGNYGNQEDRIDNLFKLIENNFLIEKTGTIKFRSNDIETINNIINLVRSLGGIAIKTYKENNYIVKIYNINNKLHPLISKNKKERLLKNQKKKRNNIVKIEKTGLEEAQCISVSHESKLYITDDYITTHNTAIVINVAVNACKLMNEGVENKKDQKAVGFFSLEMSADQLSARILSMETSISATKFRTGEINEEEWQALTQRSAEIAQMPFFIDDTPALSIAAIRTRTRRLVRKHNLGFLLIDYLQLIRGSSKRSEQNRVQEVSEITQGLKAIAKEFNIPVIALSQLSRAVEQREDKRPQLSDLRESGSIEQDADVVAFIYRESYYEERRRPPEEEVEKFNVWKERMNKVRNVSEVIIAKQRNGPIGSVSLYFDPEFTRFNDLDLNH